MYSIKGKAFLIDFLQHKQAFFMIKLFFFPPSFLIGAVNHIFRSITDCFLPQMHNTVNVRMKSKIQKNCELQLKLCRFPSSILDIISTADALTTQPRLHPTMIRMLTHAGGINVSIYWWEMRISEAFYFSPSGQVSRQHQVKQPLSTSMYRPLINAFLSV